jgi:NAD(P)-dependent dehydrogenase (short-subunit alcohol dehydrogenase family)
VSDVKEKLSELFSLEDKVILLTGAAGGIGSELAKGLAEVGANMALCDLNMDGLKEVEDSIKAEGNLATSFQINMLDLNSIRSCVDAIIEKFGKIDVLINCAGINKRDGCLDMDEETYDRIMGVNLKGVFFLSQEVAKHMVVEKKGSIINIASHNSVMMLGGCGAYGASKSGVAALTRAQAIEWAKHGIRSNALAPGHISTPLTAPLWTDPERSKYLLDRIAMARAGTPRDLLGMVILLASDASSYMTGMMYHVDGGCLAGGQPWHYNTKY